MHNKDFLHNIGHKVRIMHMNIDKYFNTAWKKVGIEPTRMQCGTLHYLREREDVDVFQKDLEAAFSISGATATNILKIMEKEGLINRIPMEKDARLKKLVLRGEASECAQKMKKEAEVVEEKILEGFETEEIDKLREYLGRIMKNVEKNLI